MVSFGGRITTSRSDEATAAAICTLSIVYIFTHHQFVSDPYTYTYERERGMWNAGGEWNYGEREGATHRAFRVAVYQPAGPDVLVLVAGEDDQQGLAAANEAVRGAGRVDRCSVH